MKLKTAIHSNTNNYNMSINKTDLLKDTIENATKEKVYKFYIQYPHVRRICHALKFEIKTETILITKKHFIKNYKNLLKMEIPNEEIDQRASDNFDLYTNKEYDEIDTRLLNTYIKPCETEIKIQAVVKETNEIYSTINNEITATILNIKCIN